MAVVTPAYAGGESVVGFARETAWGTPQTAGSDPNKTFGSAAHPAKFLAVKEETFEPAVNSDPQLDDMVQDREVYRVIANGNTTEGSLRLIPGPESIGYLLTMIFGTPSSTQLAESSGGDTDTDVWQHVWYPGYNTRANWPAMYSIESRLSSVKSKLAKGAIIRRLPIDLPNNGPMSVNPDFIAKAMQILTTASGGHDDEGN